MKLTIKQARLVRGLTQMEVADMLRVHYQTIRNWEHGRTTPTFEEMQKLATLYGVDLKNLLLKGEKK